MPDQIKENKEKMNTTVLRAGSLIVGSLNKSTGGFSTSLNPAVHPSMGAAKAEAARLAANDKDKKYVVLRVEAIASANDISWE